MYLNAKRYVWYNETEEFGRKMGDLIPPGFEVKQIEIRAAYWRKANEIHAWFVKNIQDDVDECEPHFVPREKLQELIDLCKEVLADRSKASELLPTQSGFFFGSTEYDEYYFDSVKTTVDMLKKALKEIPDAWDFEYQSSW